jgi:hypothetical protein
MSSKNCCQSDDTRIDCERRYEPRNSLTIDRAAGAGEGLDFCDMTLGRADLPRRIPNRTIRDHTFCSAPQTRHLLRR